MKYIRSFNTLNENVGVNFLEEFFSSFTELIDDDYELEFRNPYGENLVFQDYLEKNETWKNFSSSFLKARVKQLGIFIHTLIKDYDGFCKLVDDMKPVILSLDDLGWNFIRFNSSIFDVEFVGVLYTFQNDDQSTIQRSLSDKEIFKEILSKGFEINRLARYEDEDSDEEVVEVSLTSKSYDGMIPSNIDDIVHRISSSLGFHDYVIDKKTNYSVLVKFYL